MIVDRSSLGLDFAFDSLNGIKIKSNDLTSLTLKIYFLINIISHQDTSENG